MRRDDVLAGGLLAVIGLAGVAGAAQLGIGTPLHPQSGFFPLLGAGGLSLLAAVLMLQAWLGRSTGSEPFGETSRPAILVAGMSLYVAVLEPAGYMLATALLAVLMLRVLRVASWRVVVLSSVLLSVGTYLLFRVGLGIDLPAGLVTFLG